MNEKYHAAMERLRTQARSIDSTTWEAIDQKRKYTKGWWFNMNTIRVRYADHDIDEPAYMTVEINVKGGLIFGVRIIVDGIYLTKLTLGPHITWGVQQFMDWFCAEQADGEPHLELFIGGASQMWCGPHNGLQAALDRALSAFTVESGGMLGVGGGR